MFTLFTVLIIIVSIFLIIAVLLQSSKKEGLGAPLGDMQATQLIGARQAGDLIEHVTWGLIISLFALAILSTIFLRKQTISQESPNIDRAQENSLLPKVSQEEAHKPKASKKSSIKEKATEASKSK